MSELTIMPCSTCGQMYEHCKCPKWDRSQLHVLPKTGYAPNNAEVAAHLRETAEAIAADDSAEVRGVQVIIEYADGSLQRNVCGGLQDVAWVCW